jgi:hypothetical protein
MAEQIKKYNSKGNLIYRKDIFGVEFWYDNNENLIRYRHPLDYQRWDSYDENNYHFFFFNTNNSLYWKKPHMFLEYHDLIRFF